MPISQPGSLTWESSGKQVGPNLAYNTTTSAGAAKVRTTSYLLVHAQVFLTFYIHSGLHGFPLNTVYTPKLENITATNNSATTTQPGGGIYSNSTAATINGTICAFLLSYLLHWD